MTVKPILALLAAAALAACASSSGYQQAARADGVGYTDQRIEDDRWRVTYRAATGAPAGAATDFAILRAAEIATQRGYDWFQVVARDVAREQAGSSGPRIGVGVGTGGRIGGGFGGVSVGTSTGGGADAREVATLEVRMGRGDQPEGADFYDARAVYQSLRPGA